jgi:hypothetical protein
MCGFGGLTLRSVGLGMVGSVPGNLGTTPDRNWQTAVGLVCRDSSGCRHGRCKTLTQETKLKLYQCPPSLERSLLRLGVTLFRFNSAANMCQIGCYQIGLVPLCRHSLITTQAYRVDCRVPIKASCKVNMDRHSTSRAGHILRYKGRAFLIFVACSIADCKGGMAFKYGQ